MSDEIKRVNYYEKQFLRVQDFQDEQSYHIAMRRRHLIGEHNWGIVTGLEVNQDPTSKTWVLQPGLAIDGFGREIVVPAVEPLDVGQIAAQLVNAPLPARLRLWLAYRLEKAERPPTGYEPCDTASNLTRVRESFRLLYQDDPPSRDPARPPQPFETLPDDPSGAAWPVYLGRLTWNQAPDAPNQKTITAFEANGRRYAGMVGAELRAPTVAQSMPPGQASLKSTLLLRAEEARIVGLAQNAPTELIVEGKLTVQGDLNAAGQVNGRNMAADGDKLDAISPSAREVALLSGSIEDGQTLPLPDGFSEAQCKWIVSPQILNGKPFDPSSPIYRVDCSVPEGGRVVRVGWWRLDRETGAFILRPGTANFLVIGVK